MGSGSATSTSIGSVPGPPLWSRTRLACLLLEADEVVRRPRTRHVEHQLRVGQTQVVTALDELDPPAPLHQEGGAHEAAFPARQRDGGPGEAPELRVEVRGQLMEVLLFLVAGNVEPELPVAVEERQPLVEGNVLVLEEPDGGPAAVEDHAERSGQDRAPAHGALDEPLVLPDAIVIETRDPVGHRPDQSLQIAVADADHVVPLTAHSPRPGPGDSVQVQAGGGGPLRAALASVSRRPDVDRRLARHVS